LRYSESSKLPEIEVMVEIKVDATEAGAVMGDEVVMQLKGDSIGKKLRLVLLLAKKPNPPTPAQFPLSPLSKGGTGFQVSLSKGDLGGSHEICMRKNKMCEHGSLFQGRTQGAGRKVLGLALFIAVLLMSESVAATPKKFSPHLDPPSPPF
jgi:hypothetical protein